MECHAVMVINLTTITLKWTLFTSRAKHIRSIDRSIYQLGRFIVEVSQLVANLIAG